MTYSAWRPEWTTICPSPSTSACSTTASPSGPTRPTPLRPPARKRPPRSPHHRLAWSRPPRSPLLLRRLEQLNGRWQYAMQATSLLCCCTPPLPLGSEGGGDTATPTPLFLPISSGLARGQGWGVRLPRPLPSSSLPPCPEREGREVGSGVGAEWAAAAAHEMLGRTQCPFLAVLPQY